MRYVDNVLVARDTVPEPFGNSLFSLVTGTARLPSTGGSGTARTQEDAVPSRPSEMAEGQHRDI